MIFRQRRLTIEGVAVPEVNIEAKAEVAGTETSPDIVAHNTKIRWT